MQDNKVMIFGTFDIFHPGHINFIKQSKQYGNYLIVVVARDETVKLVKGSFPQNRENHRAGVIKESGLANEVVLGDLVDRYAIIKKKKPAVICLGYDQQFFIDKLRWVLDSFGLKKTKIIRLRSYYPNKYKSSKLKKDLRVCHSICHFDLVEKSQPQKKRYISEHLRSFDFAQDDKRVSPIKNKIMKFSDVSKEINKHKNNEKALILSGFFKTGKGQYGEGDKFLGLIMPIQRDIAKRFSMLEFDCIKQLLKSEYHDFRMIGLLILTYKYEKADIKLRKEIYQFYLKNLKAVNNWDLVDLTVPQIMGRYLWESGADRKILYKFVKSKNLWERRISILATFYFLKNKDSKDTLKLAEMVLKDREDLIHKATGWMLREMGKRDLSALIKFLDKYATVMPRTMLRYSIEKLTPAERSYYLKLK
ncbi:MAG: DNA alkylation repair protein [Candidatus Moraniibacteriota bacterium]